MSVSRPDRGRAARADPARPRHLLLALGAFCAVLVLTHTAMLAAAQWDAATIVLWEATLALFFASGLIALWRQPHNPFGSLLLLAGLAQWCAGLQTVPVAGLAAIGSLTKTLPLAVTVHVILAFPTGRVAPGGARFAVVLAYVTSTVLEVPSMVLAGSSALRLVETEPTALLDAAVLGQRLTGLTCLVLAMSVLAIRLVRMKRTGQTQLGPFVLYAFACLVGLTVTLIARLIGPLAGTGLLERTGPVQALLVAALPVVFLFGVLTGSFGRTGELREFLEGMSDRTMTPEELDGAVSRAIGVPGSRVVYRADGVGDGGFGDGEAEYVDATGTPVPPDPAHEALFPIRHDGAAVGAVGYRPGAQVDPRLLEAVADASALVISHQRTLASLRAVLLDLRRTERALRLSRRRIAVAGDRERRRIARDLHDGVQQHAMNLGLLAQQIQLAPDPAATAASAAALHTGVITLLAEVRNLIGGIMPAPLVERGIVSAVRALAGRSTVPVDVQVHGPPRRLPAEIESTVYFVVSEAIANTGKYAQASTIRIVLTMTEQDVVAEIADDGIGGAVPGSGTGLVGLRDRVAAFGGTLSVTSPPGAGTQVRMMIPCG